MRIVTLLPSATEIVAALGFGDQIVGRSHECDFPPPVMRLPACTAPKFDPDGSSAEIDRRVKSALRDALSVYAVDSAMLRRLNPGVIVTQSQCEVCAVSMRDVEEAVAGWLGSRPRIVSLAPNSFADIWNDVQRVADALDASETGADLVRRLRDRCDTIVKRASELGSRPGVACIEWIEPLIVAGNWMPELIEMAGGSNLTGVAGERSPRMSFDDLLASDAEVLMIAPCGFKMERTLAELPALAQYPGWAELRAVREHRVFVVDGNQYFNRPGPRIVESLEIVAELIHPEVFRFGHEGQGWRRV